MSDRPEDDDERCVVPAPSPEERSVFGEASGAIERFAGLLGRHGVERGLIGPSEVPRLWQRHLLNSAAVVPYLPAAGSVADVGSGAGLPGVVVAVMRPDLDVHLVEPMQRRTAWLREVVSDLGLLNVTVHEARAQDLAGFLVVDVVTARAVASITRLVSWTTPLLGPGGRLLLLKGRRAEAEVAEADVALRSAGACSWVVHGVDPGGVGESTAVVEIRFQASPGRVLGSRPRDRRPRRSVG